MSSTLCLSAIPQFSMAAISFVTAFKKLKIAQSVQITQLFQLLNLIAFYGLSRTLMSKIVNNDASKDSPIERHGNELSVTILILILGPVYMKVGDHRLVR